MTVELRKYDPSEARDEQGRWARQGTAIREGVQRIYDRAKSAASDALRAAGHAVKETKVSLQGAYPVRGGGVHLAVRAKTAGGSKVVTHLQLRPEHLGADTVAHRALGFVHDVLTAYGRPAKEPISGPGNFYSGTYAAAGSKRLDKATQGKPSLVHRPGPRHLSRGRKKRSGLGRISLYAKSRDDASTMIENYAADLRRADPTLTFERAYVIACEQNPAIYEQMQGRA